MLTNKDLAKEVRHLLLENDETQRSLAIKMGFPVQKLNKAIHAKIINDSFVNILDALGYDVEIVYHKRSE